MVMLGNSAVLIMPSSNHVRVIFAAAKPSEQGRPPSSMHCLYCGRRGRRVRTSQMVARYSLIHQLQTHSILPIRNKGNSRETDRLFAASLALNTPDILPPNLLFSPGNCSAALDIADPLLIDQHDPLQMLSLVPSKIIVT